MDARTLRAVAGMAVAALAGLALLVGSGPRAKEQGASPTGVRISAHERAAGARFAPDVPPGDRAWIQAAIDGARPEAQRLIAEVDGLVEYEVHHGDPFAVTQSRIAGGRASFVLSFDVGSL